MTMGKIRKSNSSPSRVILLGILILFALILFMFGLNAGAAQELTGVPLVLLMPAAFLSGILSFLSPCSLPILPAYFAYSFQSNKKNIVLMTVSFFLGLAATMTVFGASVSAVGSVIGRYINSLNLIGGLVIITFGILSIFGKGVAGIQFQDSPVRSIPGSFIYGATFAIGWTACIGPILGAILTLLVTQGAGIVQGALLSFIYALGLGLPLIIISTFFSRLGKGSRFWQFIKGKRIDVKLGNRNLSLNSTEVLSGLLLIGMGILLLSGKLTEITRIAANSPVSSWVVNVDEKIRILFGLR